jgi:DNA-binding response OmpR family regulator
VTVLLVEDDPAIAQALSTTLGLAGFETEHVSTAAAAFDSAAHADIVVLDLGLPDLDGIEVCRRLRSQSDVAILILTARADQADKLLGFEVGADDYVVKPFHEVELLARLRAISRRLQARDGRGGEAPREAPQVVGSLSIDRRTRRVHRDGREIELTAREFDILAYLALDPGAVHSRDELLTELWDANWFGPTKTVDVHVASLRRKLGSASWIQAVRGIGFRLEIPGDDA